MWREIGTKKTKRAIGSLFHSRMRFDKISRHMLVGHAFKPVFHVPVQSWLKNSDATNLLKSWNRHVITIRSYGLRQLVDD